MTKLNFKPLLRGSGYFISHHRVVMQDEPKKKLRVVFNAYKTSSKGVSLNDTLMAVQQLRTDLPEVVLHWHRHYNIINADIRQIRRYE